MGGDEKEVVRARVASPQPDAMASSSNNRKEGLAATRGGVVSCQESHHHSQKHCSVGKQGRKR